MGEASDYHLAELAPADHFVHHGGFPGARDIQNDLQKALTRWQLTEAELLAENPGDSPAGGCLPGFSGRGREGSELGALT
jgi:hypothetical protein